MNISKQTIIGHSYDLTTAGEDNPVQSHWARLAHKMEIEMEIENIVIAV